MKCTLEEGQCHPHIPSLRGALATKQSRVFPPRDSGLLRCARNDDVETVARQTPLSCPGRSAALLQRCAAEPGPMRQRMLGLLGPGSAQQRKRCSASGTREGVSHPPPLSLPHKYRVSSALNWP
ncbi:hypothetical protein EAS61_36180 [Bradyrhizobium zhanjiangense]|uniref:Uncharacterized protein n=1 Tax=Bradyrhizobium zhanjiangense TaxID=1325107 RepID=A0A4Q0Q7S2_9BRAD|nr:hypothetical protein EAS61_36180 [Bradyrhizobium zhanjiangense]